MAKVSRKPFSLVNQQGADPATALLDQNFKMGQQRHVGQAPTDLPLLGGFKPQVHDAQRPSVIACDQQDPTTVLMTSQPVGEELLLTQCWRQCREVIWLRRADLHVAHAHTIGVGP